MRGREVNDSVCYKRSDVRRARAGSGRMRTLCLLQFFFRRMFMSFPRKRRRASADSKESFLAVLRQFKLFVQLDTKIARARSQDEPVLYEHVLPGLDVLLCTIRGAQPPYPMSTNCTGAALNRSRTPSSSRSKVSKTAAIGMKRTVLAFSCSQAVHARRFCPNSVRAQRCEARAGKTPETPHLDRFVEDSRRWNAGHDAGTLALGVA